MYNELYIYKELWIELKFNNLRIYVSFLTVLFKWKTIAFRAPAYATPLLYRDYNVWYIVFITSRKDDERFSYVAQVLEGSSNQ